MLPTFDDAAILVTQPARVADVRTGDIVVRRDGERLIVHRVVGSDAGGLITRGDANDHDDAGRVTDALIDGRVVAIIYGAGR
jgi:phage repressor protein C with HTH and peptisase S24 domain